MEQSHATTLAAEAIDDCLRRGLARRDDLVLNLIADFGLERLRSCLVALLSGRQDIDFARWSETSPEEQVAVWAKFQQEQVLPRVRRQIARSKRSPPARSRFWSRPAFRTQS